MINESNGEIEPFWSVFTQMCSTIGQYFKYMYICFMYNISTSIRTAENGAHLHARNGGHPAVAFPRHVDLCNSNINLIKIVRYFFHHSRRQCMQFYCNFLD